MSNFVRIATVFLQLLLYASAKPSGISCGSNEFLFFSQPAPSTSPGIQCRPCMTCPPNQIVHRPCTKLSDTVCGPFHDFEFFNSPQQSERPRLLTSEDYQGRERDAVGGQPSTEEYGQFQQCFSDEWSRLCYVLIYAVPFSMILVFAVTLVAWYRFLARRKTPIFGDGCCMFSRRYRTIMVRPDGLTFNFQDSRNLTTITGDRRVRHLERQLHRQRQQREDRLGLIFHSSGIVTTAAASRRIGNDYVDFRSCFPMTRRSGYIGTMPSTMISDSNSETAPLDAVNSLETVTVSPSNSV